MQYNGDKLNSSNIINVTGYTYLKTWYSQITPDLLYLFYVAGNIGKIWSVCS
jgi:hypothetical protein